MSYKLDGAGQIIDSHDSVDPGTDTHYDYLGGRRRRLLRRRARNRQRWREAPARALGRLDRERHRRDDAARAGQVKLVAAAVAAWTMVRLRRSKRPGRLLTVTDDFCPRTREGFTTIQQRIADAHDQWADSIEGDVRVPDGPGGQDQEDFGTWWGHAFWVRNPVMCCLQRRAKGDDRNRTGVNGFAGRCVATPPRRPRGKRSGRSRRFWAARRW